MAVSAYVETALGGLPAQVRSAFRVVFDYVLTSLRLGRPVVDRRAENMQWYFIQGTTPAVANEEFSIAHGLGRAPYVCLPVVPLDAVGGALVRLAVPRVADERRVYLTSPDVDAPVMLLIEG